MSSIITDAGRTPVDHIRPGMRVTIGGRRLVVIGWSGRRLLLKEQASSELKRLEDYVVKELVARGLAFYGDEPLPEVHLDALAYRLAMETGH